MDTSRVMPVTTVLRGLFEAGDPAAAAKRCEQENLQILTRLMDCVVRGDNSPLEAVLTPDAEIAIHAPAEFPWIRQARGPAEIGAMIGHNFAALADQVPEIHSVVAQGDSIVLTGREGGRIRDTGQPYDVYFAQQYRFREGKITEIRQVVSYCEAAPSA